MRVRLQEHFAQADEDIVAEMGKFNRTCSAMPHNAGGLVGDLKEAEKHLKEAQHIAERGPMPLYLADVHLHRARLFKRKDELKKARDLIEKHGYWRRREELADAEEAAKGW